MGQHIQHALGRVLALSLVSCAAAPAVAEPLQSFGVLAGSAVTNTGPTVISGNVGVSPGSAVTGFPPGLVTAPYAIYTAGAVSAQAQSDLQTAYNVLAGRASDADLTGQDLGGQTLRAGVYSFSASSQLTGTLTLDARNNPNAVFIFNIGSTLTTASASSIALINGAQASNVFFRVGSSATLGAGTSFAGEIFALSSISLTTGANITCGAALATNGAVTLDTNTITVCPLSSNTYVSGVGSGATTANQRAVASAIDRYVASGGVLPFAFQVLLGTSSQAELAAAASQLSGEAGAGVRPVAAESMNAFMSSLFDSTMDDGDSGSFDAGADQSLPPSRRDRPGQGTVRALGYAPDPTARAASPFGAIEGRQSSAWADTKRWTVWGAGYGGRSRTDGDASRGSHDRTSNTFGFAAGADYRVTPDMRIGFALGGGASRFGLSEGFGGGRFDTAQAAFYARSNVGRAYVMSAVAVAWNDVSTDRTLTIGGADRLSASFNAHTIAGTIEAGYRFGWLIPFASLGVQAVSTPAYSETGSGAGPSIFALSYDSATTVSTRTQLGVRAEQRIADWEGMSLHLRAKAAWAHNFSHDEQASAQFQALPGSTFTVSGAERAKNALLLSAGPSLTFRNGLTLAATVDGQFASGAQSYFGRGHIRYAF